MELAKLVRKEAALSPFIICEFSLCAWNSGIVVLGCVSTDGMFEDMVFEHVISWKIPVIIIWL